MDMNIIFGPYKFSLRGTADYHGFTMSPDLYVTSVSCWFYCIYDRITEYEMFDTKISLTPCCNLWLMIGFILGKNMEWRCLIVPMALVHLSISPSYYKQIVEYARKCVSWMHPKPLKWDLSLGHLYAKSRYSHSIVSTTTQLLSEWSWTVQSRLLFNINICTMLHWALVKLRPVTRLFIGGRSSGGIILFSTVILDWAMCFLLTTPGLV